MLHAIKPMIWQALQTLKEPNEDTVKRSKLQVLSHNLSADGVLSELLSKFDASAPKDMETVDTRLYIDTVIHEAIETLVQAKSEKEQKICVERVHEVCWALCRPQLKVIQLSMLTEESTKIWWKIFTTFAERDNQNERTLYPVVMDWEEVDYWANVVLKVMALPTNTMSRKERDVMGQSVLSFQDALVRFNAKLNEHNGMYVLDNDKPDLKYIENAMQELNIRLFEGIHLNGFLLPVKKNHTQHPKWCVLYQLGMAFADNPAEVDSSNPRAFIPIGESTEVTPIYDKSQRPVRFQLKNGKDSKEPLVFEANNISIRNKWVTAIICLKHGKLPDYEKDFINRRKTRIRNRIFEAEAKETMRQQKERTKKQVEDMARAMEHERELHQQEAKNLRDATTEQLQERIKEHDCRMAALMHQMTELGEQYAAEQACLIEKHEREMQQMAQQHGDQLVVQNELELEAARLKELLEAEREAHERELKKRDARIAELEMEVARLNSRLDSLTKEKEDSDKRHSSESMKAASELAVQRQANEKLSQEAQQLTREVTELRNQVKELEVLRQKSEDRSIEIQQQNAELKEKLEKFEESAVKHSTESMKAASELAEQRQANEKLSQEAQQLTREVAELRDQVKELEVLRKLNEESKIQVEQLTQQNAELSERAEKFEDTKRELQAVSSAKDSMEKHYEALLSKCTQNATEGVGHRGPGFSTTVKLRNKQDS